MLALQSYYLGDQLHYCSQPHPEEKVALQLPSTAKGSSTTLKLSTTKHNPRTLEFLEQQVSHVEACELLIHLD